MVQYEVLCSSPIFAIGLSAVIHQKRRITGSCMEKAVSTFDCRKVLRSLMRATGNSYVSFPNGDEVHR